MVPYADAGPLYGLRLPTLISVDVTPGVCARTGAAMSAASCIGVRACLIVASGLRRGLHARPCCRRRLFRNTAPGEPVADHRDTAGNSGWHRDHEYDQKNAEDRPRRCLRNILRQI